MEGRSRCHVEGAPLITCHPPTPLRFAAVSCPWHVRRVIGWRDSGRGAAGDRHRGGAEPLRLAYAQRDRRGHEERRR